jgi:hypothetical protein
MNSKLLLITKVEEGEEVNYACPAPNFPGSGDEYQ